MIVPIVKKSKNKVVKNPLEPCEIMCGRGRRGKYLTGVNKRKNFSLSTPTIQPPIFGGMAPLISESLRIRSDPFFDFSIRKNNLSLVFLSAHQSISSARKHHVTCVVHLLIERCTVDF